MRFLSPLVIALTVLIVCGGKSPAQKIDEREIKGIIIALDSADPPKAFSVIIDPAVGQYNDSGPPVFVYLRKDTQIMFSDKQKAKPSDLKLGQRVGVRTKSLELGSNGMQSTAGAEVIVIEKSAREILNVKDVSEIAKQVDFAKEYLWFIQWNGYASDRPTFSVAEDKDGPVFVWGVNHDRPNGARLQLEIPRYNIYAVAKSARVPPEPEGGTKIRSAEELAKALIGTQKQ